MLQTDQASSKRLLSRDFVLICAANFCFWAAMYCMFGAMPLYALRLGGSIADAGLATGAIPLTSFFTQLLAARYLARLPRVAVMAAAPIVLPIGAAVAYFAPTPSVLVIASVILGTGYTTFQAAATTLAADVTPPTRRGEALGTYGTFTTLAVASGTPLGVALLQGPGFGVLFISAAAIGFVPMALAIGVRSVPAASSAGPTRAVGPPDPIIYFSMFVNAGLTFTHGVLVAFVPLYAKSIGMDNPGLFFSVYALGAIAIRVFAGRLSDVFGRLQVIIPSTLAVWAALWAIAAGPSVPILLGIGLMYGLGFAALHPTNLAFAVDRATVSQRPLALAIVNNGFGLGMGTGAILMGPVVAATSFGIAFALAGLVPVIATGAFLWRYRVSRPARLS